MVTRKRGNAVAQARKTKIVMAIETVGTLTDQPIHSPSDIAASATHSDRAIAAGRVKP
jgi:hypothetical protein